MWSSNAPPSPVLITKNTNRYQITWSDGPLGLTIIPGEKEGDLPVIKQVTGKGTSKGLDCAQIGDLLLMVDDLDVSTISFDELVHKLKHQPRPTQLTMEHAQKSPSTSPVSKLETSSESAAPSQPPQYNSICTANSATALPPPPPSRTYSVLWSDGMPLGLTVDAIASGKGAYIKRLSSNVGVMAASHLPSEVIGDRLIKIQGQSVEDATFPDIVAKLKQCAKPVTLTFFPDMVHEQPKPDTFKRYSSFSAAVVDPLLYEVEWTDGPLGMALHEGDTPERTPYIGRLTGSGCARHLSNEIVGDVLVSINGMDIRNQPFLQVMHALQGTPKPLTLQFRKWVRKPAGLNSRQSSSTLASQNTMANPPRIGNRRTSMPTIPSQPAASGAISSTTGSSTTPAEAQYSELHTPFLSDTQFSGRRHQHIVQSVKKI